MITDATRMCAVLVGLPEHARILGVSPLLRWLEVHVRLVAHPVACTCRRAMVRNGTRTVRLVDLPSFGQPVRLVWHKQRWLCRGLMAEMSEFELLRNELDTKITAVTVENVKMSQAIGSYGERFAAVEARFDTVDARFDAVEQRIDATDMRLDYLSQDMDRRFEAVDRRFDGVDRQIASLAKETDRRFNAIDRRMEKIEEKLDSRFGWQTFLMFVLGALILFDDTIRPLIGL